MSDKEIPILTNIADALKAFSDMHPSCLLFLQILGLAYLLVGIAYLTTSFLMRKTVFTSSSHNDISIAVQVNGELSITAQHKIHSYPISTCHALSRTPAQPTDLLE